MVSVIFIVLEVSFWALTTVVKLPWKFLTLIWVRDHSRSFKLLSFESLVAVSIRLPLSMAVSCMISEIKRDICRKSWFFHTSLHLTPHSWRSCRSIAMPFGRPMEKARMVWPRHPKVKKVRGYVPDWQTNRQTDGRTSCGGIASRSN